MMREEEMFSENILICPIDEELDGKRADTALADRTEFSRSALARLMESGAVTRDGIPITKKTVVTWETRCRSFCPKLFRLRPSRRISRWISFTRTTM